MQRIKLPRYLVLSALTIGLGVGLSASDEVTKKVKKVPAQSTTSVDGKTLFREYCAVCHGVEGRGNGPAAEALKKKPTDLTAISMKNGGKYPEVRVERMITGADNVTAHGAGDMPVWGPIFRNMGGNPEMEKVRVFNLVKYIEQIQAK